MSIVYSNELCYYERLEDDFIESKLLQLATTSSAMEFIVTGESGVGKTCFINHAVKTISNNDCFDKLQIIYYDALEYGDTFNKEIFYNTLIYKTLTEKTPSLSNTTKIDKNQTFINFLERKSYQKDIKNNIKQSLISSLSLIPYIGTTINNIFKIESKDYMQIYFDNSLYFFEYINHISENGLILIIDNANIIPAYIFNELNFRINNSNPIAIIVINSLKNNDELTHSHITTQKIFTDVTTILIDKLSINDFDILCSRYFSDKLYVMFKKDIEKYYEFVERGNFRLVDEFIFRSINKGLENINDSPLIENIYDMDEIKQNILNLLKILNNGVSEDLIKKIIMFNDMCSEERIETGLAELVANKYIIHSTNNVYSLEHNKIKEATIEIQSIGDNSDRIIDLYESCKNILTREAYNDISDCDFVFCITELLKIQGQLDLVKHIGIISKYINILDMNYRYEDIALMIQNIIEKSRDIKLILLFPVNTILKILNAFQKTSKFKKGIQLANTISEYYNINMYLAKFQLQMYDYIGAAELIGSNLNSFEAYSIYINALQHLRHDIKAKALVFELIKKKNMYADKEFYYVILRNSGHLMDYNTALKNLQECIEYFMLSNNSFALATSYNNIGLIYLYNYKINQADILVARKHFHLAQKTMREFNSSEEYQSTFNIGLSYMCEKKYNVALRFFEQALQLVPGVLTFDIKKFICTQCICRLLNKEITPTECRNILNDEYIDVEKHADPWLKFMYEYNLETLDSIIKQCNGDYLEITNNYIGIPNIYGVEFEAIFENNKKSFILAPSPHWRY